MKTLFSLLLLAASLHCYGEGTNKQRCALIGQPSIFWRNNEWQTFQNGKWAPYFKSQNNDLTRQSDLGPTPGSEIAPPNIGIGRPNGQIGERTIGIGRPNVQMGQPNAQIGKTTIGIGRPNVQMGQNTIRIGQPNTIGQTTIGIGQPNVAIGQPTIGIGKPLSFPRAQPGASWHKTQ